ncbi:CHAT domain-containing protein [Streptomyces sp. NPDC051109]|uniref:CHAT domain-containing protein n=1 Tax=Streptomyces sp. NPDC051109 TaxID=3365642 RepID=UPI0037BDABBC
MFLSNLGIALDELRAEAAHGPIVVCNVSGYRSDSLLLTAEGITSLPLPRLDRATVIDRINAFRLVQNTALAGTDPAEREQAQVVLVDALAWLWDAAAGPGTWRRWGTRARLCPTRGCPGPAPCVVGAGRTAGTPAAACRRPSHGRAAGPYRRTVMDRVVSSHTPTVRALRRARERGRSLGAGAGAGAGATATAAAGRELIVAMPTTPGLPGGGRLRFADAEAAVLEDRFAHRVVLGERDRAGEDAAPTKANVPAHLPRCAIAHFACHGTGDPADPSQSRLLLRDHAEDPLTVKSLDAVALDHARLAYLSACRTAAGDTAALSDEAIHLTSAFQLAGFPHVIGTLWEIDDQTAVHIARAFYDGLATDSGAVDPDRAGRPARRRTPDPGRRRPAARP